MFPERLGGICAADLGRLLPVNKKRAGVDFDRALKLLLKRLAVNGAEFVKENPPFDKEKK